MKALSKAKAATIYQVAQRAGVSIATVSRALRDSRLVAADTRARVQAAAAELHFTPNRSGRSLAEGRHAANGIVFPDLVGPYYAEVVLGYEEAAAELGRSVLILATHGRPDAAAAVHELAGRVDGLAIMGQTVADDVVAASPPPGRRWCCWPATRSPAWTPSGPGTSAPPRDAHRPPARPRPPQLRVPRRPGRLPRRRRPVRGRARRADRGRPGRTGAVTVRVRSSTPAWPPRRPAPPTRPDAVVCANDEVALGVHLAAEDAGLTIPADVAVTGWDDLMAARFVGLTTVRQPMRRPRRHRGPLAARPHLDETRTAPVASPARRVLPTQLVVRRSCGIHPSEVRQRSTASGRTASTSACCSPARSSSCCPR